MKYLIIFILAVFSVPLFANENKVLVKVDITEKQSGQLHESFEIDSEGKITRYDCSNIAKLGCVPSSHGRVKVMDSVLDALDTLKANKESLVMVNVQGNWAVCKAMPRFLKNYYVSFNGKKFVKLAWQYKPCGHLRLLRSSDEDLAVNDAVDVLYDVISRVN